MGLIYLQKLKKKNRVASNVPIVAMNWRDNVRTFNYEASGAGSAVGIRSMWRQVTVPLWRHFPLC